MDLVKYTLDDWLHLHDLSAPMLLEFLEQIEMPPAPEKDISSPPKMPSRLSFEQALEWITDGIHIYFPERSPHFTNLIDQIQFETQQEGMDYPCVTFDGLGTQPTVYCDFDGSPEDVLMLAHECGHAIQFLVAQKDFIPPIWRETFAFLTELILVQHAETKSNEMGAYLRWEMKQGNQRYFGKDLRDLSGALLLKNRGYYYRANYTPARILAYRIFTNCDMPEAYRLLEGHGPKFF